MDRRLNEEILFIYLFTVQQTWYQKDREWNTEEEEGCGGKKRSKEDIGIRGKWRSCVERD